MHILILNGPNLNLLGSREPETYGSQAFGAYLSTLREQHPAHTITYQQSNYEGYLIDALQEAPAYADGVILNAGGYTHTSISLRDAVQATSLPVIEVHISNILAREAFRATSYLAPVCRGTITGFGLAGYGLAIIALQHYNAPSE